MKTVTRTIVILAIVACVAAAAQPARPARPKRSESLLKESRHSVRLALDYLAGKQGDDGAWRRDPAITALVVSAMLGSGDKAYDVNSVRVKKGLAYIRSCAQKNGGIYAHGYANYSTSLCVMALVEAKLAQDVPMLKNARAFLLGLQADGGEELTKDKWQWGGWGYEQHAEKPGMHTADMINTQTTAHALTVLQKRAKEEKWHDTPAVAEATDLAFAEAALFLTRCQNLQATNPHKLGTNDGGFRYRPDETRADGVENFGPVLKSYGSVSYAGCKSLLYCKVAKDDPRVVAVYKYLGDNWTVKENPNLGQQSLFFYYKTMTRCLNAYGDEFIVDAKGRRHDWRSEVVKQLLKIQGPDNAWHNPAGRWMERWPELTTAYAVLAMTECWKNW